MPDRKPKCTETVTFRLPEDLVAELAQLADRCDRTLSDYVRAVLSDHAWGHGRILRRGANPGDENNAGHCNGRD